MGNGGKQSKDAAEVTVETPAAEASAPPPTQSKFSALRRANPSECCSMCCKTLFVLLGGLATILSFSMITITVLTAITTKAYDTEQSSRLVAMVLLAVTAAITTCIVIYAAVAVFKKRVKPVHSAVVVLVALAVIQSLIAGISVNVTDSDEQKLSKSLVESFKLSRDDNPRHVKLWATTQSDLNCCGIFGPEDYRNPNVPYYFPPNIPISCCPTYDSDLSDLVQERERETCKARKTYQDIGCKDLVLTVFKETSSMVLGVTVTLIVVELLLVITGGILCKRRIISSNTTVEIEK